MENETVEIPFHDRELGIITTLIVEKLGENLFRATTNEVFIPWIIFGVEFETHINGEGQHELVCITKKSPYITETFLISSQLADELKRLGDEIVQHGGNWQLDMGSVATINLPPNCKLAMDEIIKKLTSNIPERDN